MKYLIVPEKRETRYSAYFDDLPRSVSTGQTPEETEVNTREAIGFHIERVKVEDLSVPVPATRSTDVEVAA